MKRLRYKRNIRRRMQPRMVKLLPNIVTAVALCTGLSAVRFALWKQWEFAVIAIILAGVLDLVDGRLARFLNSATDFGAELDSLSDFISFGVAPALILYLFALQEWSNLGWGCVLFFSVCTALRLARFNVHRFLSVVVKGESGAPTSFFTGIPAPAGAFLTLLPMMFTFAFDVQLPTFIFSIFLVGTSLMMVSRIPTFSLKKGRLPSRAVAPILLSISLLCAMLFSFPWGTLCGVGMMYLLAIPFSMHRARKYREVTALPPDPVTSPIQSPH